MKNTMPVGENRPLWESAPQNNQPETPKTTDNTSEYVFYGTQGYPAPPAGTGAVSGLPPLPATPPRIKEPYHATRQDAYATILSYILSFLWVRWIITSGPGWQSFLWVVLFIAALLGFANAKGVTPPKESWFWLGTCLCIGFSFALRPTEALYSYRLFSILFFCIYAVGSVFGCLLLHKTSDYLPLDILNLTFYVPFKNIGLLFKNLAAFRKKSTQPAVDGKTEINPENKSPKNRTLLAVLLGIGLCLPLLAILLPLLLAADGGGFEQLFRYFFNLLSSIDSERFRVLRFELFFAIPLAILLCGLVCGCAHKRYTKGFDPKKTERNIQTLRLLPTTTLFTLLLIVSLLYGIFVACQVPYFFSAFSGQLPSGWQVYSDYARRGFFELCSIVGINLALMAGACLLGRNAPRKSNLLRVGCIILSGVTLILIATAISKMLLYIDAYGLSPKRLLTTVFMLFLAALCVAFILRMFHRFSLLRFAAFLGSALFCVLLLSGIDGLCMRYNVRQYIAGHLDDYDSRALAVTGDPKSYDCALELYIAVDDPQERLYLYEDTIDYMRRVADRAPEWGEDTIADAIIRSKPRFETFSEIERWRAAALLENNQAAS